MPYLNPPQTDVKPSSRFSALRVFKLKSGPANGSLESAPHPPPKDAAYASSPNPSLNPPPSLFYSRSLFSRSATSLAPSLSPDSVLGPATPSTPCPPIPSAGLEFGKRSNGALATVNGRAAAASPAPSASGASLRSFGRGGGDSLASPSMDGSTDSSGSCPNTNANLDMYLLNGAGSYAVGQVATVGMKPKKSTFRLASLAKKNRSKKDLSDAVSASQSVSRTTSVGEQESAPGKEGDEGISLPWNFQHNIHVDEGYIGLPPSWSSVLSRVGFDEDEIAAIHARRRAAATNAASSTDTRLADPHTTSSTERPASPHASITAPPPTVPTSSSTILLEPLPRSTSLGRGRDALAIHPPSMYSVASTSGGPPSMTGRISPAPSSRAPSFSVKSLVSGIKNSLTSDSASMKEITGGSSRGEGTTGEESEQYVLVDGDGPEEDGGQGMGDETFIEPYPYDTSSVSSHHTHTSRVRQVSQGQQTPRIPIFPQIQVQHAQSDTGHVSFSSSVSRAPSPLAHSTSLPIPTPPHGYPYSDRSASPLPPHTDASAGQWSGPASAPPRTPPRRIYHIANASSDSYDGTSYSEPPPAYVSPKKGEWIPKDKEGVRSEGPPPPNRPVPPVPTGECVGEPSGSSDHDSRGDDQGASVPDTTSSSADDIPGTADEVLDITSYYGDDGDAEVNPAQQARLLCPTPPLVIDKRMTKLATLPPRISFHQEGSLEDWSESLFSVIGSKGKRSSILIGSKGRDAANMKERRTTIRPISPPSMSSGDTSTTALNPLSPDAVTPCLPDVSLGANLTFGSHARGTIDAVEEGDEEQAAENAPEVDAGDRAVDVVTATAAKEEVNGSPVAPSTPLLPDISLGPNVSCLGKDIDPPTSVPPSPSKSPHRTSVDNLPPSPPPKSKPRPAPLTMPPAATLAPPRTNVITGISGRSPVNPLFGVKPQPLPIPIPPSQIRAQLRPAPPKPPHPPPLLPLPPLKRLPSHSSLQLLAPQSQVPPVPSAPKVVKHDSTASPLSPSNSRPSSSQTLLPVRANAGDRDSGLSTITVTPATITTAKTEVVRTAVASVIDPDAVSLASKRESVISTADAEPQALAPNEPDACGESPHQEREEVPDDSMVSETSSVSLLRDGSQSKWPTPPPPPVELEPDSTPRRVSRFRTTSVGRVSQLQAMGGTLTSPISFHFPHGSSDTTSNSTSESAPLMTPKGVNGVSPPAIPKAKGSLAAETRLLSSMTDTFGGVEAETEGVEESEVRPHSSETPLPESHVPVPPYTHPLLAQLHPYISPRNPASCFTNLVEIAEGESGSVFASRVALPSAPHEGQQNIIERPIPPGTSHVAIKRIPLPPIASSPSLSDDAPISNKLVSVLHELCVLKNLDHEHLLLLDAIYVSSNSADIESNCAGAVDTSLWIRMELMERSLADVIGLVAEGLPLQERLIARFASDILHGLDYLQRQHIAHRDVRSDNLLVNASGFVKLADFSNAIRVDRNAPIVSGAVGVIYWQAPEMRAGPYNALKVDVWSLGATVWELAETVPPFSTPASPSTQVSFALHAARHIGSQWPPLTHPEHYLRPFHEFLKLCGRESAGRPRPGELLNTPFIRNACGRAVILQLLSQCRAIEEAIAAKEAPTSQ